MPSWSEVPIAGGTHRFQTTRWSLVVQSSGPDEGGRRALEELCAQYWPPIYAFARRRGHDPANALDLTQGFFLDLLERRGIDQADPARGRFRTFLLTCFTNFLANERARAGAHKRGGDQNFLDLDLATAEGRYDRALADDASPDRVFERQWALTVLEVVIQRVRAEYAARNRAAMFDALEVFLQDPDPGITYRECAERLAVSEGSVKVTVFRMRQRFREFLLEEVSQTLDEGADAKAEIGELLAALGGTGR